MIKKIFLDTNIRNNLISEEDHIIVGFSGGPDSLTLLHLLNSIKDEKSLNIYTAHLNHSFRGEEADGDEKLAKVLSDDLGVKYFSKKVDCSALAKELGISSEDAGRRARYSFFSEIAESLKEKGVDADKIKIAIGQNKNDQAETVLFRLIRGSGTDGLGGIEYISTNSFGNTVIRPILDIWRKDIEKYCSDNNLAPLMDKTNEKSIYTRNKLRLDLIPAIEKDFNRSFQSSLVKLSRLAREDRDFIWKHADIAYEKAVISKTSERIKLDQSYIKKLDKAVWSRVLMKSFKSLSIDENISTAHIDSIGKLLNNEEGIKIVPLSEGWQCRIGYGSIEICRPLEASRLTLSSSVLDISQLDDKIGIAKGISACFDADKLCSDLKLSIEDVQGRLNLRTRESGDFIRMKDNLGRKKIKNLFIDMKIPKSDRDGIMMVALGSEVLWILPSNYQGRTTGKYAVDEGTSRVVYLEILESIC